MLVGALLLLAGYAAVFVGLARLFRTHTDDRGDLLDVMLLVSALVAIAWTVLIDPLVDGNASDPVVVSLALMDPILDLVLLGLLVGAVRRHATGAIVCAMAMVFLLLGDIGAVGGRLGGTAVPLVGTLGWLAAFVLLVIGCLRPMVPLVLRVAGTPGTCLRRLGVLAGAALVPLAMAGVQVYRNDAQEPLAVGAPHCSWRSVARLSGPADSGSCCVSSTDWKPLSSGRRQRIHSPGCPIAAAFRRSDGCAIGELGARGGAHPRSRRLQVRQRLPGPSGG